ncbi:hypothetical protein [Actinoplanes sp. NPDC051411]|uniref:hypothetical protein n=1 Tax=Actinoplanes sp. NPDC051411 TaxID=3155522 RepID=UPI0034415E42
MDTTDTGLTTWGTTLVRTMSAVGMAIDGSLCGHLNWLASGTYVLRQDARS